MVLNKFGSLPKEEGDLAGRRRVALPRAQLGYVYANSVPYNDSVKQILLHFRVMFAQFLENMKSAYKVTSDLCISMTLESAD